MIEFEPFDFNGCGLTLDDLDIRPANPLPDLSARWHRRWWHETGHETLEEHACAVIERYARPTLDRLRAGEHDRVFNRDGEVVSLHELTSFFRARSGKIE